MVNFNQVFYFHGIVMNIPNVTKLGFVAFEITENNYLFWILDVKIHLNIMIEMKNERFMFELLEFVSVLTGNSYID